MTSVFELLPEDMIQEIVEICPESILNIALASKQLYSDLLVFSNLYIKTHSKQIKPSCTSPLITYAIMLDDELFFQWGLEKSSFEKELSFVEACLQGDLTTTKHIYSLGVDVDKGKIKNMSALEHAIKNSHEEIVNFLVDRNVCCYIDEIHASISLYNSNKTKSRLLIIKYLLELYSRYGKYDSIFEIHLEYNMLKNNKELNIVLTNAIIELIPYGTLSGYSGLCYPCLEKKQYQDELFFCHGILKCEKCKLLI